jgi:hypothetical protein
MNPRSAGPGPSQGAYEVRGGKILAPAIEVTAVEHCNLACRSCSHLSPIFPRRFIEPDAIASDLARLTTVFHAGEVRLLGGEPTLHPRLIELIEILRRSGIADRVGIETNGTLLARLPEAFWAQIDDVSVTLYPGHDLGPDLEGRLMRLAEQHGANLMIARAEVFRESHAALGTSDGELVRRIYNTCKVAHDWRCHTIVDGRFYKCPQACSLPRMLGAQSDADADSVDLTDPSGLFERLMAYLESPEPLRSCRHCLGTVGKLFSWSEPSRKSWGQPQQRTSEDLINWRQLERDEYSRMMRIDRLADAAAVDAATRTGTMVDLLKALPRATIQAAPASVHLIDVDMGSDKRPALFMHPQSSVEFPDVEVKTESVFVAGIGIRPDAWDKPGDGVDFTVSVRTADGGTADLFSHYLDAKRHQEHRGWVDVRVPLASYAGETIRIVLSTGPGPAGDMDYDWAVWGEPAVVSAGVDAR